MRAKGECYKKHSEKELEEAITVWLYENVDQRELAERARLGERELDRWFDEMIADFKVGMTDYDACNWVGCELPEFPPLHTTMTIDKAIEIGILDEWGCHKGCGEYFYSCTCQEVGV